MANVVEKKMYTCVRPGEIVEPVAEWIAPYREAGTGPPLAAERVLLPS